jgi:hypothetical protein
MATASHAEQLVPGGAWRLLVLLAVAGGHGVPAAVVTAPATCHCYQGKLRTFLNPYGRQPGSGSTLVRGRPAGHAEAP